MTLAELLDVHAPRPLQCSRCADRGEPATAAPGHTLCLEHLGHALIHAALTV